MNHYRPSAAVIQILILTRPVHAVSKRGCSDKNFDSSSISHLPFDGVSDLSSIG
jgi:hypothetical protein